MEKLVLMDGMSGAVRYILSVVGVSLVRDRWVCVVVAIRFSFEKNLKKSKG